MIKYTYYLIILLFIVLIACSSNISLKIVKNYPTLDYRKEVFVIELSQQVPDSAEMIGQIRIGDSGFSINCGYDKVIQEAKFEARKIGGNAIKILEHKRPSVVGSSCHRIKANILRIQEKPKKKLDGYESNID